MLVQTRGSCTNLFVWAQLGEAPKNCSQVGKHAHSHGPEGSSSNPDIKTKPGFGRSLMPLVKLGGRCGKMSLFQRPSKSKQASDKQEGIFTTTTTSSVIFVASTFRPLRPTSFGLADFALCSTVFGCGSPICHHRISHRRNRQSDDIIRASTFVSTPQPVR